MQKPRKRSPGPTFDHSARNPFPGSAPVSGATAPVALARVFARIAAAPRRAPGAGAGNARGGFPGPFRPLR